MKDPIKIIHKYKNNNRRIQYKVYIFVGSLVPTDIMKILDSIVDTDLFSTLNSLIKTDYEKLEQFYGKFWYEKFFISYHINSQRSNIINNATKKKSLESKYGKEWYNEHIDNPPLKKISYSFSAIYYNYLLMRNKIKTQTRKVEMDFRTYGDIEKISSSKLALSEKNDPMLGGFDLIKYGGKIEQSDNESEEKTDDEKTDNEDDDDEVVQEISEEDFEEQIEEDFNLDEITKLYSTVDVENAKTIVETSKLISEAINDKKWDKEIENLDKTYDDSNDDLTYDIKIEDIYKKYYITNQYIFKDDTIKNMRQKITVSLPISTKFGKSMKLLPEAQYFWSEYKIDNKEDLVMLGQKWIRRNELLKIDIKPNENIKVYEKLRNNLSYLKDSFGYKIKREDDETNIIRYYENFMTMNEIFMLDIYNDLGLNYKPEPDEKRNLYDVYTNIYYPMITYERLETIIQLLNGKSDKENQIIESYFGTIKNDVKLETLIEETVEQGKIDMGKFNKLFSENHIIQSIIHVNISDPKNITGTTSDSKFNLYRIFDNFIVDKKYPFIQFQTPDSQLTYKFYTRTEKIDNQEVLSKWFENAPYGISFKIKINNEKLKTDDKYISIGLHENVELNIRLLGKKMMKQL